MRHELTLFHELLTFFTSARGLIAAESSVSSGGLNPPSGSPPLGAVSLPLVRWAECAVPGRTVSHPMREAGVRVWHDLASSVTAACLLKLPPST